MDATDVHWVMTTLPNASPHREPNSELAAWWCRRRIRARLLPSVRRDAGKADADLADQLVAYMLQPHFELLWIPFGVDLPNVFSDRDLCAPRVLSDGTWWWTMSSVAYLDIYLVPLRTDFVVHVLRTLSDPDFVLETPNDPNPWWPPPIDHRRKPFVPRTPYGGLLPPPAPPTPMFRPTPLPFEFVRSGVDAFNAADYSEAAQTWEANCSTLADDDVRRSAVQGLIKAAMAMQCRVDGNERAFHALREQATAKLQPAHRTANILCLDVVALLTDLNAPEPQVVVLRYRKPKLANVLHSPVS